MNHYAMFNTDTLDDPDTAADYLRRLDRMKVDNPDPLLRDLARLTVRRAITEWACSSIWGDDIDTLLRMYGAVVQSDAAERAEWATRSAS